MIKNYTTKIGVNQTVAQIHQLLSKKGARKIMNDYDERGTVQSVSFVLNINNQHIAYKLPAKVDGVYKIMYGNRSPYDRNKAREQAQRTAWRIIKDWIDSQLALIEAGCAEMTEVFLPYAINKNGETVYEYFQTKGLQQLGYDGEV